MPKVVNKVYTNLNKLKMKATIKIKKEVNFTTLKVSCGARYWEDSTVNGVVDVEGDLIPLRDGDYWCPVINLDSGIIKDWPKGTTADINYKCCDDGEYWLIADDGYELKMPGNYVPSILDLYRDSYGDYILLRVDENGKIGDWPKEHDIHEFLADDED